MFRLGYKLIRPISRVRFNSTRATPQSTTGPQLFKYFALATVFSGAGIYLGQTVFKQQEQQQQKSPTPDLSTSPLSTLSPPIYATEQEFQIGLSKILNLVGKEHASFDKDVLHTHNDSFFQTHHPPDPTKQHPHVVIYPNSTQEVSEVLKIAHEYRIPVVASSGLTSVEGQNIHTRGPYSISLSFGHMNKILEFHPEDLDIVVEPGVGWQDLDDFLRNDPQGDHLLFGPDPGMGANIAGMVGTSASGTNAFKYGTMKENVVNLTVVLADGTIIKTKQRPRKSSAGYDMTRLFIGSEGTLGVITEITLKLHVRPKFEFVSIAAFETIKDAAATAQNLISQGIQPNAIEILNDTMMSFVNEFSDSKTRYLEHPTLFMKFGGASEQAIAEQTKVVEAIAAKNNVIKFESSHDEDMNQELWSARRSGLWSTFEHGAKVLEDPNDVNVWATDIAVPISKLSSIISEINQDLIEGGYDNKFSVMGHIGDGNCHFLILFNSKDHGVVSQVVDKMVERALNYEGTSTGEHGVGVGKRKYLPQELGITTVDAMRQIKLALDPRRILNPDKIFKIDPNDTLDEQLEGGHIKEIQECRNH
ncbi:uncharacterized protein J8A68_004159 [[Candida] subhashii]|uniref:D-lactate dehydrogenase (cytochrome) n=1 Tax=[Candida] subhashii TaxID=561895 RepID=A0A8J5QKS2_9ASCO|nr:uncharacterized protein J8A68_004159 [[Candida] subhashii]KAG7662265.1 hypothetical protein J8A68_004159 [[Candida] subhashii]